MASALNVATGTLQNWGNGFGTGAEHAAFGMTGIHMATVTYKTGSTFAPCSHGRDTAISPG